MKKRFITFIALAMCALSFLLCSGFTLGKQAANALPLNSAIFAEEQATEKVSEFLNITKEFPRGNRGNRTFFSPSEKDMSDYLYNYALSFTSGENPVYEVKIQKFDYASEYNSQNVIARKKGTGTEGKQVVILSQYDNAYGKQTDVSGTDSTGALDNATGASTVMMLMEYYADKETPFDLVFVFTGAGSYNSYGAKQYVKNEMTNSQKTNTLLAVNIKRLGGDNVYFYADEVKTVHSDYLLNIASSNNFNAKKPPNTMAQISSSYIESLPYLNWAMLGEQAPFMSEEINSLNIFSGNLNTLSLNDVERKGEQNISATKEDTFASLKSLFPSYSKQMTDAASFMVSALSAPDFISVMEESKAARPSYAAAVTTWLAPVIVISVIVVLMVIIIILVKYFEKKYPFIPKIKKLKVAVFGMDYETPNDNDIFIELNKAPTPGRNNNPFDGY